MKNLPVILFFILFTSIISAQKEKLKGNKIVKTERREMSNFHTIEISDDFPVLLDEASDNVIAIEADGNFLQFIETTVINGVLTISAQKEFRKYKALEIRIYYASELNKVILNNNSEIKSSAPIRSNAFSIDTNDDTEAFLTINADTVKGFLNGKSKLELHTNAKNVFYQINNDAELTGIVTAGSLKIDMYQKGYAKLEGETKSTWIRLDNNTDFYAQKLITSTAKAVVEGSSKCYLHTTEHITIEAKNKSETYILGEPKVTITDFSGEATLYKKKASYNPNRLRL